MTARARISWPRDPDPSHHRCACGQPACRLAMRPNGTWRGLCVAHSWADLDAARAAKAQAKEAA